MGTFPSVTISRKKPPKWLGVSYHELKFPTEKLWITVFEEDDEAYDIWRSIDSESRLQRLDAKENFGRWGNRPRGPCTEILRSRLIGINDTRGPAGVG